MIGQDDNQPPARTGTATTTTTTTTTTTANSSPNNKVNDNGNIQGIQDARILSCRHRYERLPALGVAIKPGTQPSEIQFETLLCRDHPTMYSYSSILECLNVAVTLFAVVFVVYVEIVKKDHSVYWKPNRGVVNEEIQIECLKENPLSAESFAQIKKYIFLDNPDVRKYVTCMVTKSGIFSEQQGYIGERIAKLKNLYVPEEEALQIAQRCYDDNSEESPTDVWAFRGYQCLLAKLP
ncbi:bromodomain and WD repeat-containing DDB_G0285837-like [Drosophila eugracilis]|uniref:bromodomain and WD repeat-containing DDB_G0285837-like n=1 Tax=Drosophila eugracilis TaxID=29029 RepID=UPI001BDAD973|nr:bromodomain and WD repeat-containing DDB_G0285837-like [Drosophila eugracilis]